MRTEQVGKGKGVGPWSFIFSEPGALTLRRRRTKSVRARKAEAMWEGLGSMEASGSAAAYLAAFCAKPPL